MTSLKIRNWDKWQSYRGDRGQPPWIKIHRRIMRDEAWVSLSDAQRGQLISIWLLAADRNGEVPNSPSVIRKLCFMESEPDLKLFIEKGFIDANLTPRRRQRAAENCKSDAPKAEKSREAEKNTEAETETRASALVLEAEFSEQFWPTWPNKVGKPAALAAYLKARKTFSAGSIISGVGRYVADKPPDRSWLNPATFLNQQRFNDQPAAIGPKKSAFATVLDRHVERAEQHDAAISNHADVFGLSQISDGSAGVCDPEMLADAGGPRRSADIIQLSASRERR